MAAPACPLEGITSLNSTKRKGALKFYIRTRILQISRITALFRLEASDEKSLANNFHSNSAIRMTHTLPNPSEIDRTAFFL